jgi:hypothetical protein
MTSQGPDFEVGDSMRLPDGEMARVVADERQRPQIDGVNWMGDAYPESADAERDTWNGQPMKPEMQQPALIVALANDLYRDQVAIAGMLYRLRSAAPDLAQSAVIIAPQRGGRLNGGRFLGLPVMEGDVASCMVALAPPGAPV